jgi:tetratricopeptide (TPR) repeat protein
MNFPARHITARSALLLAVLGLCAVPSFLSGQIPVRAARERPKEGLLFLVPIPDNRAADSAYSVDISIHVRERFSRWHRHEAMLIRYCESTDSCGEFVPDTSAHHYARSVGADFYVFGRFFRGPAPAVDLRVFETGRRGGIRHQAARIRLQAESDMPAQAFAGLINRVLDDSLGNAIAAARDARDCWSDVVDREYESAKANAAGALRRFSNHASAASCLAYIYGATGQPDSLVWALERAAAGDSSLTHVWERLGEQYLLRGDTTRAVQAGLLEVKTDPNDVQRRVRIAALMDELGERDAALELLSTGIGQMGENLDLRRLVVRMCIQYELWECAQENMGVLYALDSSLVGDTTFYFQMIGLAQARAEPEVAIRWTDEAVKQVDSLVGVAWLKVEEQRRAARRMEQIFSSLRMAHAATLRDLGRRDSALSVYRGIMQDDSLNVRSGLAAARLLIDDMEFGSGPISPSDSARLSATATLLEAVAARSDDPDVLLTVGLTYYDVGTRLVRNREAASVAVEWFDLALQYDPDSTYAPRANAMLAIALAYLVEDTDIRIREAPSCELIDQESELVDRGLQAVSAAGGEYLETVLEVGEGLRSYIELIPQMRQVMSCDGTRDSTVSSDPPGNNRRIE